jgi:hypothetical protein
MCVTAILAVLAACSAPASGPHGWPLVYSQDFDAADSEQQFAFTDAKAWRRTVDGSNGWLEQFAQCAYEPRFRSPLNLAILRTPSFGDFVLEARLRQTGREYPHRDMCVVFAFRDAEHFSYAHLASTADENAHHVQRVDGAPRTPVTTSRTQGVDWGTDRWLPLRVERSGASVRVWLGDAKEPQLVAEETAPGEGWIGFGTFDDTGAVDEIRIWAPNSSGAASPGFPARAALPTSR